MTGNFEQPKHTGASAAWPEASTSLVQADNILTPEELAARLKVPDSWVYEKTRGRCRTFSGSSALAACRATGPIPCLRLGRYVRFNWVPPGSPTLATWLTAPAPPETRPATPNLTSRRNAPRPVSPRPAWNHAGD
jgi:hypothetical protein